MRRGYAMGEQRDRRRAYIQVVAESTNSRNMPIIDNHEPLDLNPVPDGEKIAEMACTCVFAVVAVIIIIGIVLMLIAR